MEAWLPRRNAFLSRFYPVKRGRPILVNRYEINYGDLLEKNLIPHVPAFKVTQGHIAAGPDRSATYDLLLVIHSNDGPISYCFRDKRHFGGMFFSLKFPRTLYLADGFPFEFCNNVWAKINRNDATTRPKKNVTMCAFVSGAWPGIFKGEQGRRDEGREREWSSWGGSMSNPLPAASESGERSKLPSGFRGRALTAQSFSLF